MSAIQVGNLYKHYGRVRAVDGLTFDVREGEIFWAWIDRVRDRGKTVFLTTYYIKEAE